jgi:glucose/arabinose dehydrogenase
MLAALLLVFTAGPLSAQVTTRLVTGGLDRPVRLVAPPGDPRLFVVEQSGRIRVFDRDGTDRGVFLDLSGSISAGGERGLLGLAFAPDYATTGRFYIDHTGLDGDTRLIRFLVSADPDRADPSSAVTILTVDQPYSNHNGGHLEFGPDGMLYFGLGDGGDGGDPGNRAQEGQTLLGKLLRLDVSGAGYVPAAGNPFIGTPPRDEIWSLGLRNPWCFSFDRLTGDLYIADVGQNIIEEIDITGGGIGGLNYGWRLMEGSSCYNPSTGCNDGSLTLPAHEYTHGGTPFRCSVSGGYVYRGDAIPEWQGTYFFADYCSVQIRGLRWTASGGVTGLTDWTAALTPTGGYDSISAFGQDSDGELYVLDHGGGRVHRIVPATSGSVPPPVTRPRLGQNTPNPFNPSTQLPFSIPIDAEVTLTIHDLSGRHLRTLVRERFAAGEHIVPWDGRTADARDLPGGVYIARLSTGGGQSARKMVLAR